MLATKDVFENRIRICGGCNRLFRPTWTCKECGCFMGVKARLEKMDCPLDKWKSISSDSEA